jgi:hypothetical protein
MARALDIDEDRIDEAALALLYLTLHDVNHDTGYARAWKGLDWDIFGRLHAKDLIHDPVGKSKSVVLTPEGLARCEALFKAMFVRGG